MTAAQLPPAHTAHLIEIAVFAGPVVIVAIALLRGDPEESADE